MGSTRSQPAAAFGPRRPPPADEAADRQVGQPVPVSVDPGESRPRGCHIEGNGPPAFGDLIDGGGDGEGVGRVAGPQRSVAPEGVEVKNASLVSRTASSQRPVEDGVRHRAGEDAEKGRSRPPDPRSPPARPQAIPLPASQARSVSSRRTCDRPSPNRDRTPLDDPAPDHGRSRQRGRHRPGRPRRGRHPARPGCPPPPANPEALRPPERRGGAGTGTTQLRARQQLLDGLSVAGSGGVRRGGRSVSWTPPKLPARRLPGNRPAAEFGGGLQWANFLAAQGFSPYFSGL